MKNTKKQTGSASKECSDCIETKVSIIKLDDKKSKRVARFKNPKNEKFIKHKFDGGHIKNMTSADWVLSKDKVGDVIVELKGIDIKKAANQVEETAKFLKANKMANGKIAGLILCTQVPALSTIKQNLIDDFSKKFVSPLHIIASDLECTFEDIFKFGNPHKKK